MVDVVHLDMDIYAPTIWALKWFEPKLPVGGVFIVDDYGFITCQGAKQAVEEFMTNNDRYMKMYLQTGQVLLVKIRE